MSLLNDPAKLEIDRNLAVKYGLDSSVFIAALKGYNEFLTRQTIQNHEVLSMLFSNTTIDRKISELVDYGFLEKSYHKEEVVELLSQSEGNQKGATLECEWCDSKVYVLNEHHYPISKSEGGKKVVKICPNCHCTYHSMDKCIYIVNEDFGI